MTAYIYDGLRSPFGRHAGAILSNERCLRESSDGPWLVGARSSGKRRRALDGIVEAHACDASQGSLPIRDLSAAASATLPHVERDEAPAGRIEEQVSAGHDLRH